MNRKEILDMMQGVAMAEREACAKAVEDWGRRTCRPLISKKAAAAIRARPPFRLPPMSLKFTAQKESK